MALFTHAVTLGSHTLYGKSGDFFPCKGYNYVAKQDMEDSTLLIISGFQ